MAEPWHVGVLLLGARNLPKLDTFGLSDPYACVSILSCGPKITDAHMLQLDHNVSKTKSKEHSVAKGKTPSTYKLNPQRRTRTMRKTLTPRWAQVFQFREARPFKVGDDGKVVVADGTKPLSGNARIRLLVTVHDRDLAMSDDFSGRCCLEVKPNEPLSGEYPLTKEDGSPLIGYSGEQSTILLKIAYSMCEYLDEANTHMEMEAGENDRFKYAVVEMQGWRTTMEDAHVVSADVDGKSSSFFGVYDGHGGADIAKYCGLHLHKNVVATQHYKDGKIAKALTEGFLRTDNNLVQPQGIEECGRIRKELSLKNKAKNSELMDIGDEAQEEEQEAEEEFTVSESGCTGVTCLMIGKDLYCANAGDSRAVLCRAPKGFPVAVELSRDHKPTVESEAERIELSGHSVSDGRIDGVIAVSRSLGDFAFKTNIELPAWEQAVTACPEVTRFNLQDGDEFIFLACDGIWDCMTSQAVVEFVQAGLAESGDLKETLRKLLKRCLSPDPRKGNGIGTDNMTAMIIQLKKL